MAARVVIVSGPPGAGKSTVARALAEGSAAPRAVHLHVLDTTRKDVAETVEAVRAGLEAGRFGLR